MAEGICFNYLFKKEGGLCCGWTFAKRFPSAVLRNRLKRWCRNSLYTKKDEEVHIHVNIFFSKKKIKFYKDLRYREFSFLMEKAWKNLKKSI